MLALVEWFVRDWEVRRQHQAVPPTLAWSPWMDALLYRNYLTEGSSGRLLHGTSRNEIIKNVEGIVYRI